MRHKKMPVFLIAALMTLSSHWFCADGVMAREPTDEITVWSGFMREAKEDYTPDGTHVDPDGTRYWLKNWRLEQERLPERRKKVKRTMVYQGVEREEEIPRQITVTTQDRITGEEVMAEYPAAELRRENLRWEGDFSFTAVFHSYDADYYELSGKLIPFNSQSPGLRDCEAELLAEIGVDPEQYRISDSSWEGEPYKSEKGELCRNALVTGERKVADYHVTYEGEVVFKEMSGIRCRAVYRSFDAKPEDWHPAEEQEVQPWTFSPATEKENGRRLVYQKTRVLVISLLAAVIFVFLFLWIKRKRKNQKYNS